MKSTFGLRHAQIKYVLISEIIAATGGFNDVLPVMGIHKYPLIGAYVYPFGSLAIIFWSLIIAYAIVKHHLMDINIVIKKGTVYTSLSFLILIPCLLIIVLSQRIFFGEINFRFSLFLFLMLFLAAYIFSKTQFWAESVIEKTLFRERYEYKKALRRLSTIIVSFLDEKQLFRKTRDILREALGIEKISFFALDRGKTAYTLRASKDVDNPAIRELPEGDPFFKLLKQRGKPLVKEELERLADGKKDKLMVERLDSMESEVCIPLITRGELIGIINLGKKRKGHMYSHEDLELLASFANQAAVALENSRLYEDMKKTQLLMRRSDRLAALGSLTAGLAHEIRNPLVAVKTFLQLLPERYEDQEFRGDFLQLTTSEVERITTLVTELLAFARPSEPRLQKTNIDRVLEKVIPLVTVAAKKRDIAIMTELEETSEVMLDEEQIKQVFLNIFLNAIEAISTDGIIKVTSRSIQENGLDYVQLKIVDTGKGMPRKTLDRIFDPFFTTKEKGSGLGLSVCHQIVREHKGFIEVESKPGQGTTFFVNLPLIK